MRALAAEGSRGTKYDLVLVDAPYDLYPDLQPQLARYLPHVVAEDGLVVVETSARVEPELPLTCARREGTPHATAPQRTVRCSSP